MLQKKYWSFSPEESEDYSGENDYFYSEYIVVGVKK